MILEAILSSALSGFFEVLFDRLLSRQFLDFFRQRDFDSAILERLKVTLFVVNAVLADAEEKQVADPSVNAWINELKHAVYQADDLLDEIATEALRSNVEAQCRAKNKHLRSKIDAPNMHSEDSESRLDKLISRLEHLARQRHYLGLKEGLAGGRRTEPRLPTTSLVDEFEIFGRDGDSGEIKKLLVSGELRRKEVGVAVVAIVGVGGIGKTTLAQLVYNDRDVQEHLGVRAWVCVSEDFDVFRITKSILQSITCEDCNYVKDLNVLQVKLKEKLMNQKFLLVLDDVWNENFIDWDLLRRPLKAASNVSRILVTTRNQRVATTMRAVHTHHLQPLSNQACWSVFANQAFEDEETHMHPKLQQIGKDIVKKCKGLPLAAKALGSLLHSQVEVQEWENILNSKMWELPTGNCNILPALRVSYYYLPSHLKQCFAYCSIFPKGYAFEKEKLVLLWMAEGFLRQPKGTKTMEDLGNEYFCELASRSFFQPKGLSRFIMHDLVNELAQFVAGEFCLNYEHCELQKGISERARHLSYPMDQDCKTLKFEGLYEIRFLRTFLPLSMSSSPRSCCLDIMVTEKLLPTLYCLRVLSLSHYKITTIKCHFFNHLKHVRYLDLSYTAIKELPMSVCRLYNLLALILCCCPNLTELPADMWHLNILRVLDVTATKLREMPLEFGRLRNLQKLTNFIVSGGTAARISELGDLLHLRGKLSISDLQNVVDAADAAGANLKNKKHLKEIVFIWSNKARDLKEETEILDNLQPHNNTEKLTIQRYGGTKLPDWLGYPSFSNMVLLRLVDCQNCRFLPSLGQLSALEELHISKMKGLKRIGSEFYFSNFYSSRPFKSLRILRFEDMPDWEEWSYVEVDGGDFPSLEHLVLWRCPELNKNLPKHLPLLKTLHIQECRKLDFLQEDVEYKYEVLQHLYIRSSCDFLILFPLGDFYKLEHLQIHSCSYLRLVEISTEVQDSLMYLKKLEISDCNNLESFAGRMRIPNLKEFSISNCKNLVSIPEQIHCLLESHGKCYISHCPRFELIQNVGLSRSRE